MEVTQQNILNALYQLVDALSRTHEVRDPYTVWHQNGVSILARCMSQYMGVDSESTNAIRLAGALHDIGKVGIPAEILTKPSKLSVAEYNLVKDHPQIGYDILKDIDFPWPIATMVLQHHERIDGSGYPNNLRGDEILLESQILGICDTIDAMVVDRPYRKRFMVSEVIDTLLDERGSKFSKNLVDIAVELMTVNKSELVKLCKHQEIPRVIHTILG